MASTRRVGHRKKDLLKPEPARATSQHQQESEADELYTYGTPASTYLPFRAIVRLTILRSKLEAVRYERGTRLHLLSQRAA